VQPAQPSQRHVLGGPASHPTKLEQSREYFGVGVEGERIKLDCAVRYPAGEPQESANPLVAEPDGAKTRRRPSRYIARRRKCVMRRRTGSAFYVANDGKAIQEFETDNERELLAGEGVHQRLEGGRKPRRFQTAEPIGQCSQPTIAMRHSVPLGKIDVQSEQPADEQQDLAPVRRRAE
jgi:hypothetical protein